jgi:hypothetical protein
VSSAVGYILRAGVTQCLPTDLTRIRSSAQVRIFPPASVSRPALRPTQPPIQWVPGALSPGVKRGQGVTLTTHPHLLPRSRMCRSYNSLSLGVCMAVAVQFYFCFLTTFFTPLLYSLCILYSCLSLHIIV